MLEALVSLVAGLLPRAFEVRERWMNGISDRVFLVTGGARGQGAGEARAIVRHGGRVVVTDVLENEGLRWRPS